MPLEGVSMVYTWDKAQASAKTKHTTQYFELFGNRGVWHEGWYAATKHVDVPWRLSATKKFDHDRWELSNMTEAFSQADALATKNPKKLAELQKLFDKEAKAHHVYPLDDRAGARFDPSKLPLAGGARQSYVYYPGATRIPERSAPYTIGRSYTITAELDNTKGDANGVVVAMGGVAGGWSLYVKDGKLDYVFNDFGESMHTIAASQPLPKGKVKAVLDFVADAGGPGKGANITLSMNAQEVGKTRTERTAATAISLDETFDAGADFGSPLRHYPTGYPFPGALQK